ncbi:MAG: HD domain-containing protein [Bacilli bacterium]|nr:HD domain-containing protein [Bacilli bacterium]
MEEEIIKEIKKDQEKREKLLSPYATKNSDHERYFPFKEDMRPPFWRDADRIIHSLSYNRYSDKTQVFSFNDNDHLSRRMTHVQMVSKVARMIGRCLNLNEDLIEAAALGHDIGHTPLGHVGESLLNEISVRELGEYFNHNVQSFRTFMYLDREGEGSNLNVQVLDAVLCHNGEFLSCKYEPRKKTKEQLLKDYQDSYTVKDMSKRLVPMTLEGCVVRISDIIGYIGRDIEDAILIGAIKREDIPKEIIDVLGTKNGEIIDSIILDIVTHSYGKPYIEMSESVFNAMMSLKNFNKERIYSKANTKEEIEYYRKGFNLLFDKYLKDIETNNKDSAIYKDFLKDKKPIYKDNTSSKRMVIDFLAGMTDEYFHKKYEELI